MSIATIRAALQTLHRGISGVTLAPTTMPDAINTADMPIAITKAAEGAWSQQTIGMKRQDRTWVVRVFVAPLGVGITVDEGYVKAETLLQAFVDAYMADVTLGGAVDHLVMPITDSGLDGVLEWAGNQYRGFEVRFTTVEKL